MAFFGNFVVGCDAFDVDFLFYSSSLIVFWEEVGQAFVHIFDIRVCEDCFARCEGVFVCLAHTFFSFVERHFWFGAFWVFE